MKIERISGKEERRVLIGMIVDKVVLGRITARWAPDLFQSKWANIVGELCVKYHTQYDDAPRKAIEGLFEAWASERTRDKETVSLVERFLVSLSDEYEELEKDSNSPYLIDLAAKHFNRVRLTRLAANITGNVDAGSVDKALKSVTEFGKVEMGTGSAIDVLNDEEVLVKALAERAEPLIVMPGALGERFFRRALQREGFIVFMGPEKRGKTAWLVYLAWIAMLQRKKVAFFGVGDESEEEMMLRFASLAARQPIYPGKIRIPRSLERSGKGASVVHEDVVFEKGMTLRDARDAFRRVQETKIKSKREYLRLSVHPNSSLSMKGMDSQLQDWARDGYIPDVIVGDYMDIFQESGNSGDDARHRINQTWKDARSLAQRWHALFVSATQSNAASYDEEVITRKNFSEDKRKLAHVTGMIGLNQTDEEKEAGLMRLNWVVGRGFKYNPQRCVHCAGEFAIGNPCIKSVW